MSEPKINSAFKQTMVIATATSSCLGVVADVLQPIAPFAKYLFGLSLVCLIVFIGLAFRSGWQRAGVGVLVSLIGSTVLGGLVIAQAITDTKIGFLAKAVPAIEHLQEKLPLPEPPAPPKPPEKPTLPPGPPPFSGLPGKP